MYTAEPNSMNNATTRLTPVMGWMPMPSQVMIRAFGNAMRAHQRRRRRSAT